MPLASAVSDTTPDTAARIRALYASDVPLDIAPLPADRNPWSVSDVMARVLARFVLDGGCRSVLEFGAGWSSVVLARALTRAGGGRLTSVEHQPAFSADCWALVEQHAGVDATLVAADLREEASRHGVLWHYVGIGSRLAARAPFDLVVIDAPPGALGRAAPLHDSYRFLAPGAVILLDDANRVGERTVVRRWLATYPGLRLVLLDESVPRGIAVLVHDGNKRTRIAPRAIVGTCLDRWQARRSATRGTAARA